MNTTMTRLASLLLLGCCAFSTSALAADTALASVAGNWQTDNNHGTIGLIQVTVDVHGQLQGRIVGGNHPGLRDEKNSDVARRALVLRGQVIMRDMKYDGNGRWSGGTIYSPDKGKIFKGKVELVGSDRLRVRGYIGIPLLGETHEWTRYTGTSMDLPPAH